MNPANQWGLGIPVYFTTGLATGIVLGKMAFNSSELPVLSEALRFLIFGYVNLPESGVLGYIQALLFV